MGKVQTFRFLLVFWAKCFSGEDRRVESSISGPSSLSLAPSLSLSLG